MKKFRVEICHVGEEDIDSWVETLEGEDEQEPYRIIERFNTTLYPGEKAREVLGVTEIKNPKTLSHQWIKSNLFTQTKGGEYFDTYRCEICGITAKRFGIGEYIRRDKKYEAEKYKYCKGKK
jgi:hypothetical protein